MTIHKLCLVFVFTFILGGSFVAVDITVDGTMAYVVYETDGVVFP